LRDVRFENCMLDMANFAEGRIERTEFDGSALREAIFEQTQNRDVAFDGCDLTSASFGQARCERVDLSGTRLAGLRALTDLRGARMALPDVVEGATDFAAALGIAVLAENAR